MIHAIILAYCVIYVVSLLLAIWHRKTFPLSESLAVIVIIGVGFTGLVYAVTPTVEAPVATSVTSSELIFTLAYLALISALLVFFKPVPQAWKNNFVKKSAASLAYKLVVFVIIPLLCLRVIWGESWEQLGFSAKNVPGQALAALILAICFGGFNLVAGSGAAPIRARAFSARQLAIGFPLVFLWNIFEVGLVEEFFFRAFLQTRLTLALGDPIAGICAASLLFGLAHAPGIYLRSGDKLGPLGEHPPLLHSIVYSILVLSPAGWFTGLLYARVQSLLAPILVHAAVDTVAHVSEAIKELGIGGSTSPNPTTPDVKTL